ncbi:MAG: alginate O-acetyltransferase AlgX-related protein [Chthoniobacterales bacterium]
MPKRIIKALVGNWKPRIPKRSLPSYDDPTPETNPKFSREEEAEAALKNTVFTRGTSALLIALFLGTIASVPLLQFAVEWRAHRTGTSWPMLDVFKTIAPHGLTSARTPREVWNSLPHPDQLKGAERQLEGDSVVSQWLLPAVQGWLVGRLGAGTEQVYQGREGWLFYRPDVDYVTGPGFLTPSQLKRRGHAARIQPDPIHAILQFRDQLAARGIELLILPAPTKASLAGEKLSAQISPGTLLQNSSFSEFKKRLADAGVRVFDPAPFLADRKANAPDTPLYLQTDTHWRPETMEAVVHRLAASLELEPSSNGAPPLTNKEFSGLGDVARMLKLPANQSLYRPETVTIHPVVVGNGFWRPSADADVLLLGDSFTNIFSLEGLGWGEAAGFAEQLSSSLGGRPLDLILRNSDGAFATRERLANELARGRDRLAGKRLVIWEFAARELAFGDWKLLEMRLGQPAPAHFYAPPPGAEVEATGVVEAVSSVPRPGSVPYRDHIMAVELGEVRVAGQAQTTEALRAVVYLSSMQDNVWTSAARVRPGDRVTLRLRAWSEVSAKYEQINRSEIDDPAVQLEEPAWGELVK